MNKKIIALAVILTALIILILLITSDGSKKSTDPVSGVSYDHEIIDEAKAKKSSSTNSSSYTSESNNSDDQDLPPVIVPIIAEPTVQVTDKKLMEKLFETADVVESMWLIDLSYDDIKDMQKGDIFSLYDLEGNLHRIEVLVAEESDWVEELGEGVTPKIRGKDKYVEGLALDDDGEKKLGYELNLAIAEDFESNEKSAGGQLRIDQQFHGIRSDGKNAEEFYLAKLRNDTLKEALDNEDVHYGHED